MTEPTFQITGHRTEISSTAPSVTSLDRIPADWLPDALYWIDDEGRLIHANQTCCDILGYTRDELLTLNVWNIDPTLLAGRWRLGDPASRHPRGKGLLRSKQGEIFPAEVKSHPTVVGGCRVEMCIARKITSWEQRTLDHRQFEEALEALVLERTRELQGEIQARTAVETALQEKQNLLETIVDNTAAIIFVKDISGRYLLVNKHFLALGDWQLNDLIGHTAFDVFPPDIAGHLTVDDQEVIASRKPHEFEEVIRGIHGLRTVISLKAPLINAQGEPYGICCVATDITQRREEEVQLRQTKDAAEQASRAKSDFLCMMSHELRTPLNAVIGFADALALEYFGALNERQKDYAQSISHSGQHLLQIINNILDFSRADAGQMILAETAVDIAHLYENCLQLVDLGDRSIDQQVPANLPLLWADALRMRQIIINLLGNAVKFSPPQSTITLKGSLRDDGGLSLLIQDQGIGIRPEDIPHVLEMFTQADTAMVRQHEGTGIGLPLAAKLLEIHGGTLSIDSTPGQGTVVRLDLPAERTVPSPGSTATTAFVGESIFSRSEYRFGVENAVKSNK